MAKLRIPYGLPLTRHKNQSLDSTDYNIEASPESRCLVTRFMKLTKFEFVVQKLHTDEKLLGVISSLFLSSCKICTLVRVSMNTLDPCRVARDGLVGMTDQHGISSFPSQLAVWRPRFFRLCLPPKHLLPKHIILFSRSSSAMAALLLSRDSLFLSYAPSMPAPSPLASRIDCWQMLLDIDFLLHQVSRHSFFS